MVTACCCYTATSVGDGWAGPDARALLDGIKAFVASLMLHHPPAARAGKAGISPAIVYVMFLDSIGLRHGEVHLIEAQPEEGAGQGSFGGQGSGGARLLSGRRDAKAARSVLPMVGLLAPARGRGMKTAAAIAPESRDSGAQAAATAVGKMPALKCLLAPGHDSCWVGAGKALAILAMGEWLCAQPIIPLLLLLEL
eukprot:jgi/Tetstr1/448547/TSEL_035805.t1